MILEDGPLIDGKPLLPGCALDVLSQAALQYQGQKIVFDRFTQAEISLDIVGDQDGIIVSSKVTTGKRKLKLDECVVFSDFLLLDRGILHLIHHDIPKEWFEKLKTGDLMLFEKEHQAFYDTFKLGPKPKEKKKIKICDRLGMSVELVSGPKSELVDMGYQERGLFQCKSTGVFKALERLEGIGWEIVASDGRYVELQKSIQTDIINEGDGFSLKGHVSFGEREVPIEQAKGLFVDLGDRVGLLDRAVLDQELPKFLKVSKANIGHFVSPNRPVEMIRAHLAPWKLVEPGKDFQGTLFPYQKEGLAWLDFWRRSDLGGILGDEMGLGKTVQVLALFSRLSSSKPSLIVVPTSLLFQWQKEFAKFLPNVDLCTYHGANRILEKDKPFILTTYGMLRSDGKLRGIDYEGVVLDEATAIKNKQSQAFKAAVSLKARFRISVTGTPVENSAEELNAQLEFAAYGARSAGPFLLRRTKSEVLKDLPEKIVQDVWITLGDEELDLYKSFEERMRRGLIEKENCTKMEVLEGILRLRQLCCHPSLIQSQIRAWSKCERLISDVEEIVKNKHKVVIFSQFTAMLDLISQKLPFAHLRLDGKTRDRADLVEQFQTDPDANIFLISLKAGGVGLNLTAADYVILYDPWWNEAVEQQAIDRAHRLGRKGCVIARRYLISNTIEERIAGLKLQKQKLADQLLEPSKDDLLALL